jgi:prepilin-type N-terminal cleavage/methylation domain-containing protein
MMKGKKGFTLTEVLVSVAIAGILVVAVATVFIRYHRLENRYAVKENILTEIENIYEIFTGSPVDFETNLSDYYQIEFSEVETYLYYDGDFRKLSDSETGNYLVLAYSQEENLYSLKITPHHRGEIIKFTESEFLREIRVGGNNEE